MYTETYMYIGMDMCIDLCMDMCTDMCTGKGAQEVCTCVLACAWTIIGHGPEILCRHVHAHEWRNASKMDQ